MSTPATHTESTFELRERLSGLLAQAEALVVVADCDGMQGLRADLHHAYLLTLHGIVVEARTVVGKLTTEAAA